jgi:hypothetical protein
MKRWLQTSLVLNGKLGTARIEFRGGTTPWVWSVCDDRGVWTHGRSKTEKAARAAAWSVVKKDLAARSAR